jgi:hypothetical protein
LSAAALADEDIAALRQALRAERPHDKLPAITRAALAHEGAAALVPDLTALLVSDQYVPCTALEHEFSGHEIIAFSAMQAIESIRVPPDREALRALLADRRVYALPEACYDQGAYIGDYATQYVAPAALAARLVPMLKMDAFRLAPELATNALAEEEIVSEPAIRALGRLVRLLKDATAEQRAMLIGAIERLAYLPEATAPTTSRGFALRDLGRLLTRHISKRD